MALEHKQEWLGALRSGCYEQGYGHLEKDNKFCCLGVYCRVLGIERKVINEEVHYKTLSQKRSLHSNISLPFSCATPAPFGGLTGENIAELMCLNDSGKSFSEIADFIENNIE